MQGNRRALLVGAAFFALVSAGVVVSLVVIATDEGNRETDAAAYSALGLLQIGAFGSAGCAAALVRLMQPVPRVVDNR